MAEDKEYKAIVQEVISQGRHGPFAVARSKELQGSVTFSLADEKQWPKADWPERGTYVILSKLRKKRAGWRAQQARYLGPSDEDSLDAERSTEHEEE